MSEEQRRLLEKQLWAVANILRGKMNADEYRNYILGFIFYKYLSEKLEKFINEKLLVRENVSFSEIDENTKQGKTILEEIKKATVSHLGFFLKPTDLFGYLVKKGNGEIKGENTFILENLKNVLNTIEQTSMGTASEDDFKGLFDDVVLTSPKLGKSEQKKNEVIVEVLTKLSEIDFKLEDSKSDLLGDAYEYLIGEFAAGAGKKGGEFYTPAQVSRLLAQIVTEGKKRLKSVYDPTCGSGSLLLRIGDYANVSMYYGQELNPTTYNLARMNMILHGVPFDSFSIRQGDTLVDDMHLDLQAEAVVANPPFSAKWKGDTDPTLAADERFTQYGRLAPKGAADYAFVTHMLHHLADNGVMAVVLPHGVLYRGGAEKQIRKYIISKLNCLDAVIGLPANLFYGTTIPATVLVFKKCRKDDDEVLFIEASREFSKGKNQNNLSNEHINKIFETYKSREEIEKYSHKATFDEIKMNDFNLNITRYVDTYEPEPRIDVDALINDYKEAANAESEILEKLNILCKELGVPNLAGNNLPLLRMYKHGMMQKLFTQEIRFKDESGNQYQEWEKKRLGSILTERNEQTPKSEQYPLMAFVAYEGVTPKGERYNREFLVNDSDNKKYKRTEFGDFIYSSNNLETGSIGLNLYGSSCISPVYSIFRVDESCDYRFIGSYFIRDSFIHKMTRYRQGVVYGQWRIHESDFLKIEQDIPSIDEQRKIADFLTSIDLLIQSKQSQIKHFLKLKDRLL